MAHAPVILFPMGKQLGFFNDQIVPDFSIEETYSGFVAGLDEAGRGPLAGPVVAAAVILDPERIPAGLNDSKKVPRKRREALFYEIESTSRVAFGQASVSEIDTLNILQASLLAMRRAVENLSEIPCACLVDGNQDPGLGYPTRCLVKGDGRSLSIAAASIMAKVFRDRIMAKLALEYPDYGWDTNAGYGVPHHLRALDAVGPSPHHRKTFHPVRGILLKESALTF